MAQGDLNQIGRIAAKPASAEDLTNFEIFIYTSRVNELTTAVHPSAIFA
jgi:hypothetical protein